MGFWLTGHKEFDLWYLLNPKITAERMPDYDSSSMQSSNASMMMTVGISADFSGFTINFSTWSRGDSYIMSGLDWRREIRVD